MKLALSLSALAIALSSACSLDAESGQYDCEGVCDEEAELGLIGDMEPEEFYRDLQYQIVDVGGERSDHRHIQMSSVGTRTLSIIPVPTQFECRTTEINLFLLKDQRYILQYSEFPGRVSLMGGFANCFADGTVALDETRVEGGWSVDGINLVLGDLGLAEGFFGGRTQTERHMALRFDADLITPGLVGKVAFFNQIRGLRGLEECTGEFADSEVCPVEIPSRSGD